MNRNQIIVIAACALACVGVYVFTSTKKPAEDKPVETAQTVVQPGELDIAGYVAETAATIENDTLRETVEKQTAANDYDGLVTTFAKMDKPLVVTYYLRKKSREG